MKIILETERLYLRAFTINDSCNLFKLNSNPKVVQFTGDSAFKSIKAAKIFIENYSDYEKNGFGRWAVCLKSTDTFLGWCGLKLEQPSNEVDLGFRFFEAQWGKGYATEAASACVHFGFSELKLKRIIGRAYVANQRSIAVLKKSGLIFSKHFKYDDQPAVLYTIEA